MNREAAKQKKVTVSVVIPCYNARKTLARAVDSALAQGRDVALEIILINDGSADGTQAVIDGYLARWGEDGTVRCLRHARPRGAAAGRNHGVEAARGTYVAFLDADDAWAEGKLKAQVAALEARPEKERTLCCTARELMTPEGKLTGRVIPVKAQISYRSLLRHNSINCSSVLLPRRIAAAFPMAHEDSHEDYITWLRILKQCGPAVGINEPYLKYRLSNQGKSGGKLKSARMTYKAYRYAGFGPVRAGALFVSYALHGVWKYLRA